jgi:hypothetical protein
MPRKKEALHLFLADFTFNDFGAVVTWVRDRLGRARVLLDLYWLDLGVIEVGGADKATLVPDSY